jgi:hypothetical protein
MSFEKRKADGFMTLKLKDELKLFKTDPDKLDPYRRKMIEYLLQDTWGAHDGRRRAS